MVWLQRKLLLLYREIIMEEVLYAAFMSVAITMAILLLIYAFYILHVRNPFEDSPLAGDKSRRGRVLLDEVHGQREEVDPDARLRVGRCDQHDRVAVRDQGATMRLFGDAAALDRHRPAAHLDRHGLRFEPIRHEIPLCSAPASSANARRGECVLHPGNYSGSGGMRDWP